jgi:hypothetical protein
MTPPRLRINDAIRMENIDHRIKNALDEQSERLDPVGLLVRLEKLQSKLFNYAWSKSTIFETPEPQLR